MQPGIYIKSSDGEMRQLSGLKHLDFWTIKHEIGNAVIDVVNDVLTSVESEDITIVQIFVVQ
jgi:hypothetical protein